MSSTTASSRRVRFASIRSRAVRTPVDKPVEVTDMPRAAGLALMLTPLIPLAACVGMLASYLLSGAP